MKQGRLFCLFLSCQDLQTTVLHIVFLVCLESSWWVVVHRLGLRLFEVMAWKLLIIEPFFPWKLHKTKVENCIGIWRCSWCCWKTFSELDLIRFISQFWELRFGKYWVLSGFCYWKFKQIVKIGFGKKNKLSPQCIHIAKFRNFQF
jgi:hypothetical protein